MAWIDFESAILLSYFNNLRCLRAAACRRQKDGAAANHCLTTASPLSQRGASSFFIPGIISSSIIICDGTVNLDSEGTTQTIAVRKWPGSPNDFMIFLFLKKLSNIFVQCVRAILFKRREQQGRERKERATSYFRDQESSFPPALNFLVELEIEGIMKNGGNN